MPMPKISKRLIDDVDTPAGGDETVLWDSELRGFGVRIRASGRRSFIIKYRNQFGQQRKYTIGSMGPMTPEEARKHARRLLLEVSQGKDPAAQAQEARVAPTVSDLADQYMAEHAKPKKRPLSIKSDETLLRRHILPKLGRKKIAALTRADVMKFHQSMHVLPGAANRAVTLLSKMMNLAEQWGYRPDNTNPCRHIQKFREKSAERFLTHEEINRLLTHLNTLESKRQESIDVIVAIRLLLFTGCRRGEVLTLQWRFIDLEKGILQLPETKTGKRTVYLMENAVEVLRDHAKRFDSLHGYVIRGACTGGHLVNLQKPWTRIRSGCGLDDVRLHDLRHTFASIGAASGLSLPMIGALLGHSQPQTTKRYAHLCDQSMRKAVTAISARIRATG